MVELDIRCKQECVPIVYNARYNIELEKHNWSCHLNSYSSAQQALSSFLKD